MTYYSSNVGRALSDLFPNSDSQLLQEHIRIHVPRMYLTDTFFSSSAYSNLISENYWRNRANKRKYFLNFARAKGFDPLIASNWYSRYQEVKVQLKLAKYLQVIYFYLSFSFLFLFICLCFIQQRG